MPLGFSLDVRYICVGDGTAKSFPRKKIDIVCHKDRPELGLHLAAPQSAPSGDSFIDSNSLLWIKHSRV